MHVQPYLFFEGRCDEALEFYRAKLGAEVTMLMRFKDNPEPAASQEMCAGGETSGAPAGDNVMHAEFKIGDTTLMASDGMAKDAPVFRGFSLSLTVADEADAKRKFAALSEGGQVRMPLGPTFFSPSFGMVQDRFGVGWMVIVPGPKA
ncbi:VOC family protein [Variovorax soli]|uniref:PhnB protein n=1 Tax=Variovorax soli TaxID=376815 RepID=A0ABU1N842_9BURK|nr:VOC family protein [Variovorax soli]MDR6534610.1 PhnB protein [Variovorax soli]